MSCAFSRFAIGGGAPTHLDLFGLEPVFDVAERVMGLDVAAVQASVEGSPGTVDADKLALLVGRGVNRVRIGVETFDEAEFAAVYRSQESAAVERAPADRWSRRMVTAPSAAATSSASRSQTPTRPASNPRPVERPWTNATCSCHIG